jgi:hypothetical protein
LAAVSEDREQRSENRDQKAEDSGRGQRTENRDQKAENANFLQTTQFAKSERLAQTGGSTVNLNTQSVY